MARLHQPGRRVRNDSRSRAETTSGRTKPSKAVASFSAVAAVHRASLFAESRSGLAFSRRPGKRRLARGQSAADVAGPHGSAKRKRANQAPAEASGPHGPISRSPLVTEDPPHVERENYTDNYDGTYDDPDEEADRPKGFAVQESRPTYKGPADCNIDRKYGIATPPWLNQDSPKARRRLLLSDSWSISNPNRFAEPVKMVTTPIRVRNHPRYLGLDASLWLDPTLDDLPPSGQKVGPEPGRLNEDDQDETTTTTTTRIRVISSKLECRDALQ